MNLIELDRALKQLRLGGMAAVLETRLRQAQAEPLAPIDLLSCLVSDELARRGERLLERRTKQAQFRDSQKTLDNFDFAFNKKMNRSLVFDLAAGAFIARHEDALFFSVHPAPARVTWPRPSAKPPSSKVTVTLAPPGIRGF
jgi:DNA replication protein DnaC